MTKSGELYFIHKPHGYDKNKTKQKTQVNMRDLLRNMSGYLKLPCEDFTQPLGEHHGEHLP